MSRPNQKVGYHLLELLAEWDAEKIWQVFSREQRKALILLLIALETERQKPYHKGSDSLQHGGSNSLEYKGLNSLRYICQKLHEGDPKAIQPVLDQLERLIRKLLPLPYAKEGNLHQSLRRYLGKCRDSYRPRDLLKRVLKQVEAEWSQASLDLDLPTPPCPRPEYILALAPLPQVHQALIGVLAESYSLGQSLLEGSLSAPLLFGFCANTSLPGGPLPPFRNSPCGTLQKDHLCHPLQKDKKRKRCLLIYKRSRSPDIDWKMVECRKDSLKLSVFAYATDDQRGPPIPSPELQRLVPTWYGVAFNWVERLVGRCSDAKDWPFFAERGGYDWDLVMEYHNTLLQTLRERSAAVGPAGESR